MQIHSKYSNSAIRQRPYHVENTASRPISEVKQRRVWSVLGWVTAWEHQMLLAFYHFHILFFFHFLFYFLRPHKIMRSRKSHKILNFLNNFLFSQYFIMRSSTALLFYINNRLIKNKFWNIGSKIFNFC